MRGHILRADVVRLACRPCVRLIAEECWSTTYLCFLNKSQLHPSPYTGYSISSASSGKCYDGSPVSRPDLCVERKERPSSTDGDERTDDSIWSLLGLDRTFSLAEHEWTGVEKSILMAGLVAVGMVVFPRAQRILSRWQNYRTAPADWGTARFAR